jgi:ribonuclease HII
MMRQGSSLGKGQPSRARSLRTPVEGPPGRLPTLELEGAVAAASGAQVVVGLDEVGRGAWAGPLTVGAVALDLAAISTAPLRGLADSKLLAPARREALVPAIDRWASAVAVGHASAAECDELGIAQALRLAADRALRVLVARLRIAPLALLVDGAVGFVSPGALAVAVNPVVGGDRRSATVAAASVVAKVSRDRVMRALARCWPGYGFERHKGYPTPEHRAAVARLGLCELHRRSWSVVPARGA